MKHLQTYEKFDFKEEDWNWEEFDPIPNSEVFISFYGEILYGYRSKQIGNIAFVVKNSQIYTGEFDDNHQFNTLKKLENFDKFKDVRFASKKAYELSLNIK